jgi:cysteine desulfurase
LVASAHKFHGPKGVGFLYKKKNILFQSLYKGGEQEKGLRAGTENVHNISGMATALSCSYNQLSSENNHIKNLKKYTIQQLFANFTGIKINGDVQHASSHILNVVLPFTPDKSSMILFYLDMKGIAISRGSACQSGSNRTSHVLQEILSPEDLEKPSIRISFSYQNTFEDVDALINALKTI